MAQSASQLMGTCKLRSCRAVDYRKSGEASAEAETRRNPSLNLRSAFLGSVVPNKQNVGLQLGGRKAAVLKRSGLLGVRAVATPPRLQPTSNPSPETDKLFAERDSGLLSSSTNERAVVSTKNGDQRSGKMVPIDVALARIRDGKPQRRIETREVSYQRSDSRQVFESEGYVSEREISEADMRRGDASTSASGSSSPSYTVSNGAYRATSANGAPVGHSSKGVDLRRGTVVLRKGPLKSPANGSATGSENGSSSGAYSVQTAYSASYQNGAPKNDLAMRRGTNAAASGLIGQATSALTLPSQAQSGLVPPSGLRPAAVYGLGEEEVKILPSDEDFRWSKEGYSKSRRSFDIWTFVLTLRARLFLIDQKWSYVGGMTEQKKKARTRKLAAWVRESILQLGPTFIKVGQLFSTRSDLFPLEFVEELSKLQDRVPAFSADKARALIEKELGAPVDELFDQFDDRPLAAASLGQVHRAWLPNGDEVVVKIQRPGLKELFDIDLANLKKIAVTFQSNDEIGGPSRDWTGIYDECATILYQEIDYINEGRNADRFRRDFRTYGWVQVPKVYWGYASKKVLTLEYLPGIKISDVAALDAGGYDRPLLARRSIESYLIQILKTGFFHADPHPGNLAVARDQSLIFYDFGMMGEIAKDTKTRLLEVFYAVYEKDARKVMAELVALGALVPTGDQTSVRRSIQYFLNNLTPQEGQKTDKESMQQAQDKTLAAIGEDLFAIAVDQPFRFPATFTFVFRAFTTLEGLGKILDPNFSFVTVATPYAEELLEVRNKRLQRDFIVTTLTKQAEEARDAALNMPARVQRIDDILTSLEAGDFKLRVRVLEAERAARRSSILQMATMNTVAAVGLLNIGVTLAMNGTMAPANAAFVLGSAFSAYVVWQMRRVKLLDSFEKKL